MKSNQFFPILFSLACLSVFPMLGQESKVLQKKLDSLAIKKIELASLIRSCQDTVKLIEAKQEELSKQLIPIQVREHEASIQNLLGQKGVKTVLKISGNLLENPESKSKILAFIDGGESVQVLSLEKYPYYKVKYKRKTGFLHTETLDFGGQLKEPNLYLSTLTGNEKPTNNYLYQNSTSNPKEQSLDSRPKSIPSSNSSGKCSSVQCSGTTQKGNRCKNVTTSCSGRCYLH